MNIKTEKTKIVWMFLIAIALSALSTSVLGITNTIFSDMNGDGRTDVFAEFAIKNGGGTKFYNKTAESNIPVFQNIIKGYFVDFNADNKEDLYIVLNGSINQLYLKSASGFAFTNYTNSTLGQRIRGTATSPLAISFSDFDNDGDIDAFVNGELWMTNSSFADFNATNRSNLDELPDLKTIKVDDINLDQKNDIIGVTVQNKVIIYLGLGDSNSDGAPEFYPAETDIGLSYETDAVFIESGNIKTGIAVNKTLNYYPFNTTAIQILDAFEDLYIVKENNTPNILYTQTWPEIPDRNFKQFFLPELVNMKAAGITDSGPGSMAIINDFDGNNQNDILIANRDNTTKILLRNGTSWFQTFLDSGAVFSDLNNTKLIESFDLNGDGELDFAGIDDSFIYLQSTIGASSTTDLVYPDTCSNNPINLDEETTVPTYKEWEDEITKRITYIPTEGPSTQPIDSTLNNFGISDFGANPVISEQISSDSVTYSTVTDDEVCLVLPLIGDAVIQAGTKTLEEIPITIEPREQPTSPGASVGGSSRPRICKTFKLCDRIGDSTYQFCAREDVQIQVFENCFERLPGDLLRYRATDCVDYGLRLAGIREGDVFVVESTDGPMIATATAELRCEGSHVTEESPRREGSHITEEAQRPDFQDEEILPEFRDEEEEPPEFRDEECECVACGRAANYEQYACTKVKDICISGAYIGKGVCGIQSGEIIPVGDYDDETDQDSSDENVESYVSNYITGSFVYPVEKIKEEKQTKSKSGNLITGAQVVTPTPPSEQQAQVTENCVLPPSACIETPCQRGEVLADVLQDYESPDDEWECQEGPTVTIQPAEPVESGKPPELPSAVCGNDVLDQGEQCEVGYYKPGCVCTNCQELCTNREVKIFNWYTWQVAEQEQTEDAESGPNLLPGIKFGANSLTSGEIAGELSESRINLAAKLYDATTANTAVDATLSSSITGAVSTQIIPSPAGAVTASAQGSSDVEAGILEKLGQLYAVSVVNLNKDTNATLKAGTRIAYVHYVQDLDKQMKAVNDKITEAGLMIQQIYDIINNLFSLEYDNGDSEVQFQTPYEAKQKIYSKIDQVKNYFYFEDSFFNDVNLLVDYSGNFKELVDIQEELNNIMEFISEQDPLTEEQKYLTDQEFADITRRLNAVRNNLPQMQQYKYSLADVQVEGTDQYDATLNNVMDATLSTEDATAQSPVTEQPTTVQGETTEEEKKSYSIIPADETEAMKVIKSPASVILSRSLAQQGEYRDLTENDSITGVQRPYASVLATPDQQDEALLAQQQYEESEDDTYQQYQEQQTIKQEEPQSEQTQSQEQPQDVGTEEETKKDEEQDTTEQEETYQPYSGIEETEEDDEEEPLEEKERAQKEFYTGLNYYERDNYAEALNYFAESTKLDPKSESIYLLSKTLEKLNESNLALQVVQPLEQFDNWKEAVRLYDDYDVGLTQEEYDDGVDLIDKRLTVYKNELQKQADKQKMPNRILSTTLNVLFDISDCIKQGGEFALNGEILTFNYIVQQNGNQYLASCKKNKDNSVVLLNIKQLYEKLDEEGLCKKEIIGEKPSKQKPSSEDKRLQDKQNKLASNVVNEIVDSPAEQVTQQNIDDIGYSCIPKSQTSEQTLVALQQTDMTSYGIMEYNDNVCMNDQTLTNAIIDATGINEELNELIRETGPSSYRSLAGQNYACIDKATLPRTSIDKLNQGLTSAERINKIEELQIGTENLAYISGSINSATNQADKDVTGMSFTITGNAVSETDATYNADGTREMLVSKQEVCIPEQQLEPETKQVIERPVQGSTIMETLFVAKKVIDIYELKEDVVIPPFVIQGVIDAEANWDSENGEISEKGIVSNYVMLYIDSDLELVGSVQNELTDSDWNALELAEQASNEPECTFTLSPTGNLIPSCEGYEGCNIQNGKIVCNSTAVSTGCMAIGPALNLEDEYSLGQRGYTRNDDKGQFENSDGNCLTEAIMKGCTIGTSGQVYCEGYPAGACTYSEINKRITCSQEAMSGCNFTGILQDQVSCEGFDNCRIENDQVNCTPAEIEQPEEETPSGCVPYGQDAYTCEGYLAGACVMQYSQMKCDARMKLPEDCSINEELQLTCTEHFVPEQCEYKGGMINCGNGMTCGFVGAGVECWPKQTNQIDLPEDCVMLGEELICGQGIDEISMFPPGCSIINEELICVEEINMPENCRITMEGVKCTGEFEGQYCGFDSQTREFTCMDVEKSMKQGCAQTSEGLLCEGYQIGECSWNEREIECEQASEDILPRGCEFNAAGTGISCGGVPLSIPEQCQIINQTITCEKIEGMCRYTNGILYCGGNIVE